MQDATRNRRSTRCSRRLLSGLGGWVCRQAPSRECHQAKMLSLGNTRFGAGAGTKTSSLTSSLDRDCYGLMCASTPESFIRYSSFERSERRILLLAGRLANHAAHPINTQNRPSSRSPIGPSPSGPTSSLSRAADSSCSGSKACRLLQAPTNSKKDVCPRNTKQHATIRWSRVIRKLL